MSFLNVGSGSPSDDEARLDVDARYVRDEAWLSRRTTVEIIRKGGIVADLDALVTANPWVSRTSRFAWITWRIDLPPSAGEAHELLRWEGIAEPLINQLKTIALLILAHPRQRERLKLHYACRVVTGLIWMARWMTHEGHTTFLDVGNAAGDRFLVALARRLEELQSWDDELDPGDWDPRIVPSRVGRLGRDGKLTRGLVRLVATGLLRIAGWADDLPKYGVEGLEGPPFMKVGDSASGSGPGKRRRAGGPRRRSIGGVTAKGVSEAFGQLRSQVIERIPDAVLRPLWLALDRMLGAPAEDAIRLVRRMAEKAAEGLTEEEAAASQKGFRFTPLVPGGEPWRKPFLPGPGCNARIELRTLINTIRDSCSLAVLLDTGMRPTEFVTLPGGRKSRVDLVTRRLGRAASIGRQGPRRTSMPRCITEELSSSGMTILSHVHGQVHKTQGAPRDGFWLLGGRQVGQDDPPAFRALDILERLFAPLKRFADRNASDRLSFQFANDPAEPIALVQLTPAGLGASVRASIARLIDLSDIPDRELIYDLRRYRESNGRCVNLYQCRRTFAQTHYLVDPNLLVAISRQMQHQSSAVTAQAYITDDPTLLRELERARSARKMAFFKELLGGGQRIAGTMAAIADKVFDASRKRLRSLGEELSDLDALAVVRPGDFATFEFEENHCLIGVRPQLAKCNQASGVAGWKVTAPDFRIRDPIMCTACPNAAFNAVIHGPVVLRRYRMNMGVWFRADRRGDKRRYEAWKRRADRDRGILTTLGISIPTREEIEGNGNS